MVLKTVTNTDRTPVTPVRRGPALATVAAVAVLVVGCATSPEKSATGSGRLRVVAAENVWGSLAAQLGGSHAQVSSVIDNPNADPHDYEPTAADARLMAGAQLAIVNGVGYDTWAAHLIAANPVSGRVVLTVGDVVGVPVGGNPHRWYFPPDVRTVLDAITADYTKLDPADAAYFRQRHDHVITGSLKAYFDNVASIKAKYAGTPVGASESVITPLAEALGLRLLTPESFLDAVSEGADPTAQDKATIDAQIRDKQIEVYVYNTQNATPDVQAQVRAARAAGIEVATVTETLTPAGVSFQQWQLHQLRALARALSRARP
jgi:zinc/manganese transport system substrate-binding protein